jgi:hypothetical protein
MSIQLEDPDPGLNSDPELPGSVIHNYESGSSIRKCSVIRFGRRLEVFQMAKTTSELLRTPRWKGEGARETHGAKAHAADLTDRQKENRHPS